MAATFVEYQGAYDFSIFNENPRALRQFKLTGSSVRGTVGSVRGLYGPNCLKYADHNQRCRQQKHDQIFDVSFAQFNEENVSNLPNDAVCLILAIALMAGGWVGFILSVWIAIHTKPLMGTIGVILCLSVFVAGVCLAIKAV